MNKCYSSIATKALLGVAIMTCRPVVLRHSEHEEDQEKGSMDGSKQSNSDTTEFASPPITLVLER